MPLGDEPKGAAPRPSQPRDYCSASHRACILGRQNIAPPPPARRRGRAARAVARGCDQRRALPPQALLEGLEPLPGVEKLTAHLARATGSPAQPLLPPTPSSGCCERARAMRR